jgi:tetratricopeptide (TPR) repeat protein
MRSKSAIRLISLLLVLAVAPMVIGQERNLGPSPGGKSVIYGAVLVKEDESDKLRPMTYEIVLYVLGSGGSPVARQTVSANGNYRFTNLADGDYELVVIAENNEVTRIRVEVRAPIYPTDVKQDISLEWKALHNRSNRAASVTPEDAYQRSPANQKLFDKAGSATDNKKYDESIGILKQLVAADPKDFQAWTELGTVYLLEKNLGEAEKAYEHSTEVRPTFFLALMNLGRVRMMEQKFDAAVPTLTQAVEVRPTSADANYYLGEAYLQIKKGSKAVGYLNEALKLDPIGKAEAHLRLAALYNGAGLKAKAAAEYVEFLKKEPDYPDRKKLESYIAQNKQ